MSILQIELPDEQLQLISEHARARGYTSNGEFLLSLWQENLEQQAQMREQGLTREQLQREERLLLKVTHSNRTESNPELWADLRAEIEAKVGEKV